MKTDQYNDDERRKKKDISDNRMITNMVKNYLNIFVIIRIENKLLSKTLSLPIQYIILYLHKKRRRKCYKSSTIIILESSVSLSFIPITQTFQYLTDLTLNDLEMSDFLVNLEKYIKAIDIFIQSTKAYKASNLQKITFESEKQLDRKINPVLNKYNLKLSATTFNG